MRLKYHAMRFFEGDNGGGSGGGSSQQQQQQQSQPGGSDWSWATPEGKLSDGYADRLPDDLKPQAQEIARFVDKYQGNIPAILKGAIGLQAVAGKKIGAPSKDWTPEMLAEYRTAYGIPATAEEYDLSPDPASLPEGFEFNKDVYKPLAKLAHDLNLSPTAMKQVASEIVKIDKARQEAAIEMIREQDSKTIEGLKKDFGADYEKRVDRAARAAKVLGIDSDVEKNPIANHPMFIKALDAMAAMMSEDKLVNVDGPIPTNQPGRMKAMAIMEGRHEMSDDYLGKNGHERQQTAVKHVQDLLKNG